MADAIALGQWLVGPGRVAPENVRLALASEDPSLMVPPELARSERVEPTLEGIDQALRVMRQAVAEAPAERLFVAFSGHGASANQPAYTEEALCLEGFTTSVYTRTLEVRSFLMVIDAIAAAERFIFIDGCRNHVFDDDSRFGVLGQQPGRAPGDLRNYILRATAPGRKAVEAEGRGLFSRHLVAGLKGEGTAKRFEFFEGGLGGGYRVTWNRLVAHVQKRIGENVAVNRLKQLVQESGERPAGYDPLLANYHQDNFPDSQFIISLKASGTPPAGTKIRYLRDGEFDSHEVLSPTGQTELVLSLPQATFRFSVRAPGHNWAPAQRLVELYEPQQEVEFALAEDGPPLAPFAFVANPGPLIAEQPRGGPLLDVGRTGNFIAEGAYPANSAPFIRQVQGLVGFEDQGDTLRRRLPSGAAYAVINGFSVVAFNPSLSRQQEEDIFFLLCFAQRAASARADRRRDPLAWRSAYFEVLSNLGAVSQHKLSFSSSISGAPIEPLKVARHLIGESVSAIPASSTLGASLEELHGILQLQSLVGGREQTKVQNFDLGTVTVDSGDGTLAFTLAGFRTTSKPRRVHALRSGTTKVKVDVQISTFLLTSALHQAIREALMRRLRATLNVTVDGVPLAELVPAPLLTLTREAGTIAWHDILPDNATIALDPGLWRLQLTTADGVTARQLIDVPPMEQVNVALHLPAPFSAPLAATLKKAKIPAVRGFITPTQIADPIHHGSVVTIATFAVALAAAQHRSGNLGRLGLGSLWRQYKGEGLEVVIADETGGVFRPAIAWLNSLEGVKITDARQLSRPNLTIPLAAAQFELSPGTYLLAWRDEANADAPQATQLMTIVPGHVTLVVRQMREEGGALDFQFAFARHASDLTAALKALARAEAVQGSLSLGRDPAADPNVGALAEGGWFEPFTAAQAAAAALERGERELAATLAGRLASSGALPSDSKALAALLATDEKAADDAHGLAGLEGIEAKIATTRLRLMLSRRGL